MQIKKSAALTDRFRNHAVLYAVEKRGRLLEQVCGFSGIIGYLSKYYRILCHLLLLHWPFIL